MKLNYTRIYLLLMGVSIFFSCKKKNEDPTPASSTPVNIAPQKINPNRDTLSSSGFNRATTVTVDLTDYFTDPENDSWIIRSLSAQSSTTNVTLTDFSINNKVITFKTVNRTITPQEIGLNIQIEDSRGSIANYSYIMNIFGNNSAPMINGALPIQDFASASSHSMRLNELFTDPEGDSWTVVSSVPDDKYTSSHSYSNNPSMMPGSMGQIIKAVSFETGRIAASSSFTVTLRDEFGAEYTVSIPINITCDGCIVAE